MPGFVSPTAPSHWADWRLWVGLAIVVLGAALALLRERIGLGRRRRDPLEGVPAPAAAPAVSPPATLPPTAPGAAKQPASLPTPALTATPVEPARARPATPAPPASRNDHFLDVSLAARRLSATLLNTALTYELVVTNRSEMQVGPLTVSCDMIGAHASLPARVQLENPGQGEPAHRIPRLAPGESATMSGELRLPLNAITPIRRGPAALFVPLVRFHILTWREGRPPVSTNRTFVIGEAPPSPQAALKPFRLDLGPRMYSSISQREVAVPA